MARHRRPRRAGAAVRKRRRPGPPAQPGMAAWPGRAAWVKPQLLAAAALLTATTACDATPVGPLAMTGEGPVQAAPDPLLPGVPGLEPGSAPDAGDPVQPLADRGETPVPPELTQTGIPEAALAAYLRAEATLRQSRPECHLEWPLLAGIGRVESDHGRYGNSDLVRDARSLPPVIGVQLNGSGAGGNTTPVYDTDNGGLDGDTRYDRAVGAMQFLPATWASMAVDGDGNGVEDVQDLDDSALAAGYYLCANGADLSTQEGRAKAVFRYNHSTEYVDTVLGLAARYAANGTGPVDAPAPGHTRPPARSRPPAQVPATLSASPLDRPAPPSDTVRRGPRRPDASPVVPVPEPAAKGVTSSQARALAVEGRSAETPSPVGGRHRAPDTSERPVSASPWRHRAEPGPASVPVSTAWTAPTVRTAPAVGSTPARPHTTPSVGTTPRSRPTTPPAPAASPRASARPDTGTPGPTTTGGDRTSPPATTPSAPSTRTGSGKTKAADRSVTVVATGPGSGAPARPGSTRAYWAQDTANGWRVYALDRDVDTSAGSAQARWLRADLATRAAGRKVFAYWASPPVNCSVESHAAEAPLLAVLEDADAVVVTPSCSGHTGTDVPGTLTLTLDHDGYAWRFTSRTGQVLSAGGQATAVARTP